MILINLLRGKPPAVCDCCWSRLPGSGPLTYCPPRRLSRKEQFRLDPEESPKRIALHDLGRLAVRRVFEVKFHEIDLGSPGLMLEVKD